MQLAGQLASADFEELAKGFVLVKVDLTDRSENNPNRPIAAQYSVRSIPDIRILSAEGKEISNPGSTKSAVMEAMKKALGK
ncbi:MAG: hypothetical protein HYY18_14565 [Planctomycetes bacterium]|nr:hypothetical protein [Planctomycetota bacterium]